MRPIDLTERQGEVLRAVVLHHIHTADPVASRAVTRTYMTGVSPATIRNVMVDLEEAGLLEQPHTSAGRIPTDTGYRVFVDSLMEKEALSREDIVVLRTELEGRRATVESLLDRTSQALARVANQMGIATSPRIPDATLVRIHASSLSEDRLLLAFEFSSGVTRTVLVRSEEVGSRGALAEALGWVNRRVDGLRLEELHRCLERETASEVLPAEWRRVFGPLLDAVDSVSESGAGEQVHFGGTAHIMAQPEFNSPERLRPIMAMMEEKDLLLRKLHLPDAEGVHIVIGRENPWKAMRHMSVVLSTYRSGAALGRIGVIGPTRMPYSKVVPLVERTAEMVRRTLEGL